MCGVNGDVGRVDLWLSFALAEYGVIGQALPDLNLYVFFFEKLSNLNFQIHRYPMAQFRDKTVYAFNSGEEGTFQKMFIRIPEDMLIIARFSMKSQNSG